MSDTSRAASPPLSRLHHVALQVEDLDTAIEWYRQRVRCEIRYRDESWALLGFANASLALIADASHPPHIGFAHPRAEDFGPLLPHRDGTRSVYIADPAGNAVEMLDESSLTPEKDRR